MHEHIHDAFAYAVVVLAAMLLAIAWPRRLGPGADQVEAVAGEPFGVGRITFDVPQEMLPEPLGIEGIGLSEKHGRVLLSGHRQSRLRQAA